MTIVDATRRYKHTGSRVPDFLFAEHFDPEAKVTITACDFDSAAFADMILRHPEVVAFEMKRPLRHTGMVCRGRDRRHEVLRARGAPAALWQAEVPARRCVSRRSRTAATQPMDPSRNTGISSRPFSFRQHGVVRVQVRPHSSWRPQSAGDLSANTTQYRKHQLRTFERMLNEPDYFEQIRDPPCAVRSLVVRPMGFNSTCPPTLLHYTPAHD